MTYKNMQLRETVRVLERKLGFVTDSEFSCCGVTMAQCHALVEIGRADGITLIDLSKMLGLDASTMSRTVNGLVSNGYAERDRGQNDRRYINIILTEKGLRLFNDIENSMNRFYQNVFENIPKDKRSQVIESLGLLCSAIPEDCCKF